MKQEGIKIIARNRKAGFDFFLEDKYEAGLVLTGSEIKSIRDHHISIAEGFVQEQNGEMWLLGVNITPYKQSGTYGYVEPVRPRKLLLRKREIAQIITRMHERGFTCVPTMIYLRKGRAKVEIALAKGKKLYDKRDDIAKRDQEREIRKILKEGQYQD
ncbi:MAG: SsrA-binding protein SmpB [Chloroflexota bacterium]|nr:SsrA-binding protein SmpB [Chloroflexota bacterium]